MPKSPNDPLMRKSGHTKDKYGVGLHNMSLPDVLPIFILVQILRQWTNLFQPFFFIRLKIYG